METACIWAITLLYIYFCVWRLDLRLNNINYHQSLSFIICIDLNYHCYHYWTSESLLNLWECTQGSDITNKWVVHFVISSLIKNTISIMLWQPLITKTNDHTSNKSLRMDIKWEFYKRTWQGAFAKLEFYIYKVHMVYTTTLCPPYFLLKATMLYSYTLMSSSRSFYHVLGLWHHTMWPVMWLQCHMPLYHPKEKKKKKKINIK